MNRHSDLYLNLFIFLNKNEMGIGDWAQSPIPNPQSPIPNPQLTLTQNK